MQNIELSLAIEDVNMVLEALGNLPFARVYALVGKIQEQASAQLKPGNVSLVESPPAQGRTSAGR